MARAGHRYPLLIYGHTVKRWYPKLFMLSVALIAFWWFLPSIAPEKGGPNWVDTVVLYSSLVAFLLAIFFMLTRKMAFVRPFPTHLQIATPLFRFNLSYKRILKTSTTEMQAIFPPSSLSSWMREDMARLLVKTAIVINLKSSPIPRFFLRLFLSPFFFKDKTPHIVILVDKWLSFSSEFESFRSGGGIEDPRKKKSRNSVLSSLNFDE